MINTKLDLSINEIGTVELKVIFNKRYCGFLFLISENHVQINAEFFKINEQYSYKFVRKFNQREHQYNQAFENLKYMLVK